MNKFWGRKTFLMVSGASKGMGKMCAIEFCKKIAPGSVAILAGRNEGPLEKVKKIITANQKGPQSKIGIFVQDAENPNGMALERKVNEFLALNLVKPEDFDHALIVHGSMTQFNMKTKALELKSAEDLGRYFTVNTFSPTILNSHFMKIFKGEKRMRTIVNITSGAAERPYNSLSTFCASSTARESFMCSIAKENNGILVLNYNPGLLDIYLDKLKLCKEKEIEEFIEVLTIRKRITTCDQTVAKLIDVLEGRNFFSGEHLDYWDLK